MRAHSLPRSQGFPRVDHVDDPKVKSRELLPLIESGRLDPTEIIAHRMSLDQGIKGYEIFDAHEDDVLKVVLTP